MNVVLISRNCEDLLQVVSDIRESTYYVCCTHSGIKSHVTSGNLLLTH